MQDGITYMATSECRNSETTKGSRSMTDLNGEELSKHNAIQNAIKVVCVKERECWKEDPCTCPGAQTDMARDLCTFYLTPPKVEEKPGEVKLKCPKDQVETPVSWCMEKCHKKLTCYELKEHIKSEGK